MYISLNVTQNMLKDVADVIPHCAKAVHIVSPCDKDVMLSYYIMDAPVFPIYIRVKCPWLLTGHLLLDIYHARFNHDLHMGHGLPLADSRKREAQSVVKGLSYLSLSSGMLNRTLSHICGSSYFPMFLFRDESFTPMNIASFIGLVRFCDPLPTELKLSTPV